MFHRGPGLNLTSGQYTAPIAGHYAFSSTLHLGEPSARPWALPGTLGRLSPPALLQCAGSRAGRGRATEGAACGCSSVCSPTASTTGTAGQGQGPWAMDGGRNPASLGKEGPAPPTTALTPLQQSGDPIPAGELRGPFHHLCSRHPLPAGECCHLHW